MPYSLITFFWRQRETMITFCHKSPIFPCCNFRDVNVYVYVYVNVNVYVSHSTFPTNYSVKFKLLIDAIKTFTHHSLPCQHNLPHPEPVLCCRHSSPETTGALTNHKVLTQRLAFPCCFLWKGCTSPLPALEPSFHPANILTLEDQTPTSFFCDFTRW